MELLLIACDLPGKGGNDGILGGVGTFLFEDDGLGGIGGILGAGGRGAVFCTGTSSADVTSSSNDNFSPQLKQNNSLLAS